MVEPTTLQTPITVAPLDFAKSKQEYFLLQKNNNTTKHYVIKSIIYNYLILKKRKYSELNKS